MYFVFIFDLLKIESITKKYKLVSCFAQKPLFLNYLILYLLYKSKKKGKAIKIKLLENFQKSTNNIFSSILFKC